MTSQRIAVDLFCDFDGVICPIAKLRHDSTCINCASLSTVPLSGLIVNRTDRTHYLYPGEHNTLGHYFVYILT